MERVTFTATPELIYRIRNDFPQCIECSADHLSARAQYFHAGNCRRGGGLETDELTRRMNARYAEIARRDALAARPIGAMICAFCPNVQTGTYWERYHPHMGRSALQTLPVCEAHASHDPGNGREFGYIPGRFLMPQEADALVSSPA